MVSEPMWEFFIARRQRESGKCFEDKEHSMPDLKLLFFRTLLDWFSVWRNHPFPSILDFLDFCNVRFWFVLPCILPVYFGVSLFLISMNLYYLSKKKKKKLEWTNKFVVSVCEFLWCQPLFLIEGKTIYLYEQTVKS